MIKTTVRALGSILLTALLLRTVSAATPEEIFQDAIKYTVKVRTIIEMPFSDDEEGVFTGTGFVVDANQGWILTNAHVAGHSPSKVEVAFRKTEFSKVEKLYVDPYLDVAVLRATAGMFPKDAISAPLECEVEPPVGHPVGAFGHPWSLAYTGTRGIISSSTFIDGMAWLQTDAPINDGNSGGPLISMHTGKLVGINAASANEENVESLNFAVPMKYVCRILTLLRKGRDPSPPMLPVRFLGYNDYRQELVVAETYFDESDTSLHAGDVILRVEGRNDLIHHESQLVHLLRGKSGLTNFQILRGGKELRMPINVQPTDKLTNRLGVYVSGLIVAPSSYVDATELNLRNVLMIHHVKDGTAGQSEGIDVWDFIKSVDGKRINNIEDLFIHFTDAYEEQRDVDIVIKRINDTGRHIFSYKKISLPIEGLERIGTQAEIHALASKGR
jgi:S1-C subfamily serine protease